MIVLVMHMGSHVIVHVIRVGGHVIMHVHHFHLLSDYPHPFLGLTLSMAVDPLENWVAIGTSLGYHVVWDMRFQLPIRHWQHTGHGKSKVT